MRRLLHDDIREQSWAREITETFVEKVLDKMEIKSTLFSIHPLICREPPPEETANCIEILSMISLSLAAINAEEQEDKYENLTLIVTRSL